MDHQLGAWKLQDAQLVACADAVGVLEGVELQDGGECGAVLARYALGVVAALWAICGLKQFEKAGKTAVVVAAMAALLFFVGMFFHMMHLPGASIMLIVSMGVLIPLSAFWLACGCKCCKK